MSLFNFIAADKPLSELTIGIEDHGSCIIIEDEARTLNIYTEQFEGYPEEFTKLPHIMGVEFGRFNRMKDELLSYVLAAADQCSQMELWSIWLDDPDRNIEHRACRREDLTEEGLAWIWGQEYFTHPRCLKVYKWRRGAK